MVQYIRSSVNGLCTILLNVWSPCYRLPMDIMYGSCPTEPVSPHQYVKTLKATMEGAYEKAREHLKAIAVRSEELYNKRVHAWAGVSGWGIQRLIHFPPPPPSLPFLISQVIKTFSTREGWWYIGIKGEMVV